jgi:hypothetical protein
MAAIALVVLAVSGSATAGDTGQRVAFVHRGDLIVANLSTSARQVVLAHAPLGPVAWSGDGRLVSDGGRIAGGAALPTAALVWAPTGETAAFIATDGSVRLWRPGEGQRTILRRSFGARSLAWGPNGKLAIARTLYVRGPMRRRHEEVWVWRAGTLRRVVGPITVDTVPIVAGFTPDGHVLWWSDELGSASIAADGLPLLAGKTRLGRTLVFPDFVDVCGAHVVFANGGDRYTTRGKSIVEDGRDISDDASRSWVSPSCNGATVAAAAGRNWAEPKLGEGELRSIWQLEPAKKRLTTPPKGWTDEDPHVLADGSILFVRTRQTTGGEPGAWTTTEHASLDLLAQGTLKPIASLTVTVDELTTRWEPNYYGHYGWPSLVAVAP